MLEIKNLSKQFDGNYVLNNVSMTIEFGKIYGLEPMVREKAL